MPRADWSNAATWAVAYDIGGEPAGVPGGRAEVRLGYTRAALWQEARNRADRLIPIMSLTTADTVVVLGGAFGWLAEVLVADHGIQAVSIDTSAWIQATKGQPEDADLEAAITAVGLDPATGEGAVVKAALITRGGGVGNRARVAVADEELANQGSRNRVRGLFASGRVTVVITEDLLPALDDAEIATLAGRAQALDGDIRVGHLMTTLGTIAPHAPPAILNGKTLAQWRAMLDGLGFQAHVCIELGTWVVV